MEVTWFANPHEQRNDLLRFGFMRLHRQRKLAYREYPLDACVRFGFSEAVARHEHRHTSVVLICDGGRQVRCLIDSEDSLFWMCPLIAEVDRYFCAGYSAEVFERKQPLTPYAWQTEPEVRFYLDRAHELIDKWGSYFGIVRKFVPIAPSMSRRQPVPFLTQKKRNLKFRAHSLWSDALSWDGRCLDYEDRYRELLGFRHRPLLYDVVLLDTLWGWPRHRLKLHRQLQSISDRYRIHSRLNWSEPVPFDGSAERPLDQVDFPIVTQPIGDYETMMASSRLAVLATGFHWGWRGIMAFALMVGLPVYMDRPVLEPWFGLDEFVMFWNDDGDWTDLECRLRDITDARWNEIKVHNQHRYDQVMSPERVAEYVIETALK